MSRNARIFEILMYFGLAIGVTRPLFPAFYGTRPPSSEALTIDIAWWVLVVCLIWFTARRAKNWARWILIALFLWQTAQFFYYGSFWRYNPHFIWYHIVITALELGAYYHIFTGDGAEQFRRRRVDSVFN